MRLRKITALLAALLMAVSMIPLSVFADMGGDFPWTEESEPLLIEQILQRDGFIDGIWFPWIHGGTVGHNLTSNELMADYYDIAGGSESSWREVELDAYGADKVYREIYNLKSMGYNMMAYGGSIMAEGVVFDANGDVTGIKQEYLDNARRLLDMCREIGMPVMWNVYFHCSSMPDYYGIDGWKVMCQMLGNRTVADHYAQRFVKPLCQMLAEYPDVVALVSIADEPENEINDIGMGNHYANIRTLYGVNQDDMIYFMQQINNTVREQLPDMPRTVASNAGNKSIYRDFNLDLIGHNQYIDNPNFDTIESMISDADMLMTEYNVGNRDTDDESYANKLIAFREDLMAKGYKGGFQWCWVPRTSINNDYTLQRIASDPTSFRKTVSLLKYYMDGYRAAYRGQTIGLDAPVLYANAGDGNVLWIPSQKATTITIQRSDDGGATWKTLLSNAKQTNYVDRYLVGRYTDNTTKPAGGYCYRIVASNGTQTVTSAPNNLAGTEDKFVNEDYVSPTVTNGIFYQPTYNKTESYAKLTSIGVDKNRPANDSLNLIKNGSFESADSQWNTTSFLQYAQVVEDETTPMGSKSLYFNTSAKHNAEWYSFTIDGLEKNTDYTFSTFIKGAYLATDNKGFGSIGVIDPDTNKFMVYWDCYKNYARGSRETQQIYPPAWDDEWHLRSVTFNSGSATSVTIALYGYSSKMWVDGLALFESADGVKYNNGESAKALTSTEWEDLSATAENAVKDPDVNNAAYWNTGAGYKQGFMSVANGALNYTASSDPCAVRYTKWIDVKPNTDYYVSFTVNVTTAGGGRVAVLDNAKLLPHETVVADFSSTGTKTCQGRISSGKYDQLGLCVVDLGGCATIDNISFYKAGESQPIVTEPSFDGYIVNGNFEIGSTDGWENLWNENTIQMAAGHNSAYAISVISGQYKHVRQFVAVEPNTDYTIELWSKEAVDATLLIKDGKDTVNLKQATLPVGPDWTKTTLKFNSGDNTQIILSLMGSTNNARYMVDDVTMRKITSVSNGGFIINGDFENGTCDNWENLYDFNVIRMVDGRDSRYAINVSANQYTQVRQKVTVKKNTDYIIELWSKDASDAVLIVKNSADTVNLAQTSLPGGSNWTKTTLEFNSDNNEFIYIGLMGGANGAVYTVDDVTMYEKQSSSGLYNGDFEQQERYWSFNSGSHAIVSDSHGGNYALQLTDPGAWGEAAVQTIAVDPDSYYTITWWYKANYGTKVFNLIAMHNSGNMAVISGNNFMSVYNGDWRQGSYTVNTGSSSTMMLKFTSEVANAGTILIDDVAVNKTCPHQYDHNCDDTCNLCGEFRQVYHSYYSSVTKSPTCVAGGIRTYTCEYCSNSYDEVIPATGNHTYYNRVTQAATCSTAGVRTYYCYNCSDSYTVAIPATGNHSYSNACDYYCNVCNGYRSAPHSYSGSCDTTCNLCDTTRSTYASHTYSNACDAYCNVCDFYRTVSHNYREVHREDANCGFTGMIWYECSKCYDTYTETIPITGTHTLVEEIATPPTCNTPGQKLTHCSVCENYGYWEEIPPTGEHAYAYECDTNCMHCGQLTRPDASHIWADDGCSACRERLFNGDFELGETYWQFNTGEHAIVTDDPHGGDKALQLSELANQWGEAAIQSIPVLPNTVYEISWWYKATPDTGVFNLYVMEDAEGYRNLTAVSGQAYMNNFSGSWQKMTYRVDTGDATAMLLKFSTETVNPGTIVIDDVSVKSQYDLCRHQFTIDDMTTPSCTEEGAIYSICQLCGYQLTEIVPAQGHNHQLVERVDPSCDAEGKEVYTCINNFGTVCGDTYTVAIPASGHAYAHNYDVDCDVCGAIREVALPITFGGNSVSADVSGLSFRFDLPVVGMQVDRSTAIYDEATLGGYKLLGMGALANNGAETIDIPCVYLYDWKAGSCSFAARIIHIPTDKYDVAITATPYVVLEIDGVATTVYGEARTSTYNNAANG